MKDPGAVSALQRPPGAGTKGPEPTWERRARQVQTDFCLHRVVCAEFVSFLPRHFIGLLRTHSHRSLETRVLYSSLAI